MMPIQFLTIFTLMVDYVVKAAESGSALTKVEYRPLALQSPIEFCETRDRHWINGDEIRARLTIKDSQGDTRPIQVTDPMEDSKRVTMLVLLAQRTGKLGDPRLRLPDVLHRVIHEYHDHNEIRALFQMFTSPVDRKAAFGFESYKAMGRRYPTRAGKVAFLKKMIIMGCGPMGKTELVTEIQFDQSDSFIRNIYISKSLIFDPDCRYSLNWNAVAEIAHLQVLRLNKLGINVSLDDIKKLPDSLKTLEIMDSLWTTVPGDLDLSLLPAGLTRFNAAGCQGMNGTLKLDVRTDLVDLIVKDTDLHLRLDSTSVLPPSLNMMHTPRNVEESSMEILRKSRIKIHQWHY